MAQDKQERDLKPTQVSLEDIKTPPLQASREEGLTAYKAEVRYLERAQRRALIKETELAVEQYQTEIDSLKAKVKSHEQDIEARRLYANRIFWLIASWMLAVFFFLIVGGFSWGNFDLTDTVLVTLIGGTTANVIGIFLIVVAYLFPKGAPNP